MPTSRSARVLLLSALACAAFATQSLAPTTADAAFIGKALVSGLFEIRSAEIAMQRNLTLQEQAFAQDVMDEHHRMNKALSALAAAKGIPAAAELPADDQARLFAMSQADDLHFNADFLRTVIARHEDALGLYSRELSITQDPDLKGYAMTALPALRQHLATAQRLLSRY